MHFLSLLDIDGVDIQGIGTSIIRNNRTRQKTLNKPTGSFLFDFSDCNIASAYNQLDFNANVYDTQLNQVGDSISRTPSNIIRLNLGILQEEEKEINLDDSKVQAFDNHLNENSQNDVLRKESNSLIFNMYSIKTN